MTKRNKNGVGENLLGVADDRCFFSDTVRSDLREK